jgi:AraC family transcriptional regulator
MGNWLMRKFPDWTPIEAMRGAQINVISSDAAEWHGFHFSIVHHRDWQVDDVMYDGHYVGLNLSSAPLIFEAKVGSEWATVHLPPRAYWVIPEDEHFSVRRGPVCSALNAVIDGVFLDSIVGGHRTLGTGVGPSDDAVSHVLLALMDYVLNGSRDAQTTSALIRSMVLALVDRFGEVPNQQGRTSLTRAQLATVISWVERNLAAPLSVELMAAQLGLNTAHFSRAFKRATGKTPWGFVMGARLERAVRLLRSGESATVVAEECGFSDQAHLSRLFKRTYGISPAAYSAKYRHRNVRVQARSRLKLTAGRRSVQ